MCVYHQSSPESHFTRNRICSLATPEGRVSLDNSRLITTHHGRRQERLVTDPEEYNRLLHDLFGIDLYLSDWKLRKISKLAGRYSPAICLYFGYLHRPCGKGDRDLL